MKPLLGWGLGLLLNVPALAGNVYQWRDEQGQLHFSDRPPSVGQAVRVQAGPAGGDDTASENGLRAGERTRLREIEQQERQQEAARQARDKRAAADERRRARQGERDAERCSEYRRKVSEFERRLRAGCRVSTCNSYEAQIDDYKRRVTQHCH